MEHADVFRYWQSFSLISFYLQILSKLCWKTSEMHNMYSTLITHINIALDSYWFFVSSSSLYFWYSATLKIILNAETLNSIFSKSVCKEMEQNNSQVASCLNRSFLHLYLQFCHISVAVNWYTGTWYGVPVRDTHNFRGAPIVAQPAPTKFGTKVVIVTYSPNRSCVPILKLLASTIAERSRGPKFFQCFL